MESKAEWTGRDGRQVAVTVTLVTEERVWLDGHNEVLPCCKLNVVARVGGDIIGTGRPETITHPTAVAKIGKLGLDAVKLAMVGAAIAEVEQAPEWQAKVTREAKTAQEMREYDEHQARMRRAMGR
jgi:hypothetical protein